MQARIIAIAVAMLAVTLTSAAQARPRHAPPARHSGFLDLTEQARIAGRVAPTLPYSILYRPVYTTFAPDSFGNSVLPGRFGGIGR